MCVYIHTTSYLPVICWWKLGCVCILAVVDSAPVSTGVHVSFTFVSLALWGCIPRSGIARRLVAPLFVFWAISVLFSIVAMPAYIPVSSVGQFPFLHILANICPFLFDDGHSDRCEVISHCSFSLHFSDSRRWAPFHASVGMSSLGKCLFNILSGNLRWCIFF